MPVSVTLLQVREEPDIARQEQDCFVERSGIQPDQLHTVNVLHHSVHPGLLDSCDALFIGGAGAFSMTSDYDWTPRALELIQEASIRSHPTFGSCFGHQMIARALGGTVVYDAERTEMGCRWVSLNESGQHDPLFKGLPTRFKANMGHHDRVITLPEGALELAYNESQPYQAFRMVGKPIYGTQFHSELDAEREKERLYAYRSHYTEVGTEEAFQEIVDSLSDTTEVDGLLKRFLELYAL